MLNQEDKGQIRINFYQFLIFYDLYFNKTVFSLFTMIYIMFDLKLFSEMLFLPGVNVLLCVCTIDLGQMTKASEITCYFHPNSLWFLDIFSQLFIWICSYVSTFLFSLCQRYYINTIHVSSPNNLVQFIHDMVSELL